MALTNKLRYLLPGMDLSNPLAACLTAMFVELHTIPHSQSKNPTPSRHLLLQARFLRTQALRGIHFLPAIMRRKLASYNHARGSGAKHATN
eukprot:4643275-Amphidinium_carterae.1